MSCNGLVEAFTIRKTTEVKGAPPTIFVEVGCEVVVVSCQSRILCSPSLD